MASKKKTAGAEPAIDPVLEEEKRRDRLSTLKARRQSLGQTVPDMNFGSHPVDLLSSDGPSQGPAAMVDETGGPAAGPLKTEKMKAFRAKILPKIYLVLTQTPPDRRGMLADTDYSMAGFAKFIEMLRRQIESPKDERIGKFCGMLMKFLSAEKGEEATADGISIAKLVLLAQKGETLKGPNAGRVKPARARPAPGGGGFGAGKSGGFGGGKAAALEGQTGPGSRLAIIKSNPVLSRDMLGRMNHLLKNTPEGDEGMVPGTEFTKIGVSRLMAMLAQRSTGPQTATTDMANAILEMIRAEPDDPLAIHGAEVERLTDIVTRFSQVG